jgi:hypothetical protein
VQYCNRRRRCRRQRRRASQAFRRAYFRAESCASGALQPAKFDYCSLARVAATTMETLVACRSWQHNNYHLGVYVRSQSHVIVCHEHGFKLQSGQASLQCKGRSASLGAPQVQPCCTALTAASTSRPALLIATQADSEVPVHSDSRIVRKQSLSYNHRNVFRLLRATSTVGRCQSPRNDQSRR